MLSSFPLCFMPLVKGSGMGRENCRGSCWGERTTKEKGTEQKEERLLAERAFRAWLGNELHLTGRPCKLSLHTTWDGSVYPLTTLTLIPTPSFPFPLADPVSLIQQVYAVRVCSVPHTENTEVMRHCPLSKDARVYNLGRKTGPKDRRSQRIS